MMNKENISNPKILFTNKQYISNANDVRKRTFVLIIWVTIIVLPILIIILNIKNIS